MGERPVIVIDTADGLIRRHLARALLAHLQWCRRSGIDPPAEVVRLADAATGGQARPIMDSRTVRGDRDGVDQLALDYRDAATRLGVSDRSVRRLVADGKLPAVDVAGCTRIRVADLEDYVCRLAPMDRKVAP